MNSLKLEKKLAVISALVEGNSIRSTSRLTGVHIVTILRLLSQVGENCQKIMDEKMRNLHLNFIQVDEIWTFVQKKQRKLSESEAANKEIGDQYVFVALDAETKLVPAFAVGKRDSHNAKNFMLDLEQRLSNRIQLTTDAFQPYGEAVENAFGADIDYAQLLKMYRANGAGPGRYSPPDITSTIPNPIMGNPDARHISTSFVERQNLTMRMQLRRFTRLTNAFSKKFSNLRSALALHFAYYNFVRVHNTLRITPAMAAGITDNIWQLEELIINQNL